MTSTPTSQPWTDSPESGERSKPLTPATKIDAVSFVMGLPVLVYHSSSSLYVFFSSRRRHTRSLRDWSSDVCSSDLVYDGYRNVEQIIYDGSGRPQTRSVERRVGKECRGRGTAYPRDKDAVEGVW